MSAKIMLALLLVLFLAQPGGAQADFYIMGAGNWSCGKWIAQRRTGQSVTAEQWLVGFLSGVGWVHDKGDDPLKGMDPEGIIAWVDNYCQPRPLELLVKAAGAFALAHPN